MDLSGNPVTRASTNSSEGQQISLSIPPGKENVRKITSLDISPTTEDASCSHSSFSASRLSPHLSDREAKMSKVRGAISPTSAISSTSFTSPTSSLQSAASPVSVSDTVSRASPSSAGSPTPPGYTPIKVKIGKQSGYTPNQNRDPRMQVDRIEGSIVYLTFKEKPYVIDLEKPGEYLFKGTPGDLIRVTFPWGKEDRYFQPAEELVSSKKQGRKLRSGK